MMAERVLMPAHNPSSSRSASTNNNINSSAGATVMERAPHDNHQQQQQQQSQAAPLRCPRCDSTNTKFCYYNNYSLSQPRHFCKACKRYWTRGGTLRNVPVGGGCRKNKRVKRPTTSACATPSDPSPPLAIPPPISLPNPSPMNIPSRGGDLNPLLYNLTAASSDMGLNFSVFRQRMELPPSCGVQSSISIPCAAYDLQPQLNALGLGFASNQHDNDDDYTSGFGSQLTQLQQTASLSSAASLLHDYSLFGSSLSTATATSLLVSSLKQPKKVEDYHALLPYDDLQSSANGNLGGHKDVKIENEGHVMSNRIDWPVPCENNSYEGMAIASTTGSIDSSSLYWNAPIGAWPDAANYGPSLAPLI